MRTNRAIAILAILIAILTTIMIAHAGNSIMVFPHVVSIEVIDESKIQIVLHTSPGNDDPDPYVMLYTLYEDGSIGSAGIDEYGGMVYFRQWAQYNLNAGCGVDAYPDGIEPDYVDNDYPLDFTIDDARAVLRYEASIMRSVHFPNDLPCNDDWQYQLLPLVFNGSD